MACTGDNKVYQTNNAEYWEAVLAAEGMPAELPSCADTTLRGRHADVLIVDEVEEDE